MRLDWAGWMIGTIFLQEKDEGTKCQDNAKSV
jgi:hypothetical protein